MGISFTDHASRRELSLEECRTHLEQAKWARLLVTVRCLPAARPVPVTVLGQSVLVATDESVVWEAVAHREVLTVNVDGYLDEGIAWTVSASGVGRPIGSDDPVLALRDGDPFWTFHRLGGRILQIPLTVLVGDETDWRYRHDVTEA